MSGPASGDAFLVAKCLEFCQALSSQGQVFNISISTRSGFSSLDVRSKASPSNTPEKKASPSTLRRNAKRREEFLARKQQSSPTTDSGGVEAVAEALKCDQCEYVGASEKGLKQHVCGWRTRTSPLFNPLLRFQGAGMPPPCLFANVKLLTRDHGQMMLILKQA